MKASDLLREDSDRIIEGLRDELPEMAGKPFFLSGGGGFLGYSIVHALAEWNRRRRGKGRIPVTVCDNFLRGTPEWLGKLDGRSGVTLLRHDITRPLPASAGPFAYLVHAASIASPIYYRKHPIETMDANVTGLRLLLDRILKDKRKGRGPEGFLFFSSSEVYGDPSPEWIPTPEGYNGNVSFTGPRACYDESKRYGETLCVNFAAVHGLPVRVSRPFNNIGPGLKITDRRVIPDFARDMLAGRDLVLLSDGSPTRTFCYVTDAVAGHLKVLVRGRDGEAYNIGADKPEISMGDLAERLAALGGELFGYRGKVVRAKSPDGQYLTDNPQRRCPDLSKARRDLAFSPCVPLDEGLRRSLLWYSWNRTAEDA